MRKFLLDSTFQNAIHERIIYTEYHLFDLAAEQWLLNKRDVNIALWTSRKERAN